MNRALSATSCSIIFLALIISQSTPSQAEVADDPTVLRINVGGNAYVDHNGNTWSADAGYNTGITATAGVPIYGTDDPALHQTMRWDNTQEPELAYRYLLPNGDYTVNLYMSETASHEAGRRIFDIRMEDSFVHKAVDIYAESGGYGNALIKTAPVTVTDGELNIDFVHQEGDPVINAIEVIPAEDTITATTGPDQPLELTALTSSSNRILVSWDYMHTVSIPAIAWYRIFRDGVEVATTNLASYLDTGLSASTPYSYSVTAYDSSWSIIASSDNLNVTTLAQNDAGLVPQIAGTPAGTIQANTRYIFQPLATDNTSDPLSYSILNKPCWASFDPATGRLSGMPGDSDAGTDNDIVITVTNGLDTVSLPAFSVQILEDTTATAKVTSGSFTVSWTGPNSRADGTELTQAEIGGYRIYYGDTDGYYPHMVEITDGIAEVATVSDIPVGTYYIVMTTYDIDGRESDISEVTTKTTSSRETPG